MMNKIVQYPDPSLNVPVEPLHLDDFGGLPHVHQTLKEAMEEYNAVGIAANQLGLNTRACLVGENFLVNPVIVEQKGNVAFAVEGCLSIEYGQKGYIRPADEEVVVYYEDMEGLVKHKRFTDFEARVALHEIRHLDGKLINEGVEDGLVEMAKVGSCGKWMTLGFKDDHYPCRLKKGHTGIHEPYIPKENNE